MDEDGLSDAKKGIMRAQAEEIFFAHFERVERLEGALIRR